MSAPLFSCVEPYLSSLAHGKNASGKDSVNPVRITLESASRPLCKPDPCSRIFHYAGVGGYSRNGELILSDGASSIEIRGAEGYARARVATETANRPGF